MFKIICDQQKDFRPFNEMQIGVLAKITRSHKKKKRALSLTKLLNHRYLLVVS